MEGTREATYYYYKHIHVDGVKEMEGEIERERGTHIRIHIKRLILHQRLRHPHHLRQNKNILHAMRDFLRDELHKVRHELMQAGVLAQTRVSRRAVLLATLVQKRPAHLLKVQLQLLGQHVLDERFDGHVAVAAHGGEGRVRVRSLGHEFEVARVGGCRVLWNGWLDAFDGEPVS